MYNNTINVIINILKVGVIMIYITGDTHRDFTRLHT